MRWLYATVILQVTLGYEFYGGKNYWSSCSNPDNLEIWIMCNLRPHLEEAIANATNEIVETIRSEALEEIRRQTEMIRHIGSIVQDKPIERPQRCHGDVDGYTDIYPVSCSKKVTVHCNTDDYYRPPKTWVFSRSYPRAEDHRKRGWDDYKHGFKTHFTEWIGLETLHQLTKNGDYVLIAEGGKAGTEHSYAQYDDFRVLGEETQYQLEVGNYNKSSKIKDALTQLNGKKFSTHDNDNDESESNCAEERQSGWWYGSECGSVSLMAPGSIKYVDPTQWPQWGPTREVRMETFYLYLTPKRDLPSTRKCYGPLGNLDYFDFESY